MNRFEEQFPSLKYKVCKNTLYESSTGKLHQRKKYITKTNVINYCLDKQIIKDVLNKVDRMDDEYCHDDYPCPSYIAELILKELGLDE